MLYVRAIFLWLLSLSAARQALCQLQEPERILHLKKEIASTRKTSRIDKQIALCEVYFRMGFFGVGDKRVDSIAYYANRAKEEAQRLHYKRGIEQATLYAAFVKSGGKDFQAAEQELINLLSSRNLTNNELGYANGFLGALYYERYRDPDKSAVYLKKALAYFINTGNRQEEALTLTRLAMAYHSKSDYETAVDYCSRAVKLSYAISLSGVSGEWSDFQVLQPLNMITKLYELGGDFEYAKKYLHQARSYIEKRGLNINLNSDWAELYNKEGNYDSALYFLKAEHAKRKSISIIWELGKTYLQAKDYQRALPYLHQAADTFRSRIVQPNRPRPKLNLIETLVAAAKAHYYSRNLEEASRLAKEALSLLQENRSRFSLIDQYELLSDAHHFTGRDDSAYLYHQMHIALKDSILGKQFLFKLNNLKRDAEEERNAAQMALLKKDNQLKEAQLKQESFLKQQKEIRLSLLSHENKIIDQQLKEQMLLQQKKEERLGFLRWENQLKEQQLKQDIIVKNVLLGSLIVFLLMGIFLFRTLTLKRRNEKLEKEKVQSLLMLQQLENEKKEADFRQQAATLEMQALRAQMNPHFIFNCLSSINWLVMKGDSEIASDYLSRFSKLIRMVLVNSTKPLISLEEELKMLQLYLDMEQLRFENTFDYDIHFNSDISASEFIIPPLILQPFCENAIWHGLTPRDGKGRLTILIQEHNDSLLCTITDNGVGRKQASAMNSHGKTHESMGLKITAERLALLNVKKDTVTVYEIEDLTDPAGAATGTRVTLKIKTPIVSHF